VSRPSARTARFGTARFGAALIFAVLVSALALSGTAAPAATVASTTAPRTTTPTTTPTATTKPSTSAPSSTTPRSTTSAPTTVPTTTTQRPRPQTNTTTTTIPAPPPALAPPGVSLVSQPAWIPTQGAEILALHLAVASVAAQAGVAVQLTIHHSVTSRTDFDNAVNGVSLPQTRSRLTFPFSSIQLNKSNNFVVAFGLSGSSVPRSVGIDSPGVYPVEVGLVGTKVEHSSFLTWMVVIDKGEAQSSQPLRVSWIWQVGTDPFELPEGLNPSTLAAFQPGGRLDDIAKLLALASKFPLTLGIGPETLATWKIEAQTHAPLEPGFERVRVAAQRSTNQLLPEPYVPISGPAIEAEGLGARLPSAYSAGSDAIRDTTGEIPDPRTAYVDPVDDPTVGRLTQMSASRFVVPDSALAPAVEPLTPAQPFELSTHAAGNQPAAASDSGLGQLFTKPGTPALQEQRVLAGLAEIAYEAPSQARGVVITTPDDWSPNVGTVTLLLHDLARDPLVKPATLNTLFSEVPPAEDNGGPLQRHLGPRTSLGPLPLRASDYNEAAHDLTAYASMVGAKDPSIAAGQHALLLVLSTANTQAQATAYLQTITTKLATLTSGITTTAKTLTLTARRAYLPLSFLNNTGRANILVRVHLDSQKLIFPKGPNFLLRLPLGHTTAKRTEFPVEARASGTFAMTITLESPDGTVKLGVPTRVTIRSAVFSGIGIALTLGALLFLAFWWGNHFFRTRRVRRRARAT
jgi:Family of unknown function (DUF6049)